MKLRYVYKDLWQVKVKQSLIKTPSVTNETVTEAQHQSVYKFHKSNISAKPDVRCDNNVLGNHEYPSSAIEIQHSSIKDQTAEKKATLRDNFSFGSTAIKTKLLVNIPLINQIVDIMYPIK